MFPLAHLAVPGMVAGVVARERKTENETVNKGCGACLELLDLPEC